jgi:hypothetical protein
MFGTHPLRRTKATLIYRRTGNLRAWHTKIESTVRYLGIEVDDALSIAEQVTSDLSGRDGSVPPEHRSASLRPRTAGVRSHCEVDATELCEGLFEA